VVIVVIGRAADVRGRAATIRLLRDKAKENAVKKFTAFFCSAGRRQLFRRHCHTDDIIAGVDIMDLAGHGTRQVG
jgi:Iap family predicted aminopeptidase